MKNADMPAMPQSFAMTEQECGTAVSHMANDELPMNIGLTKREMFAMNAMQGLLSDGSYADLYETAGEWRKNVVEASVEFADALLEGLSK